MTPIPICRSGVPELGRIVQVAYAVDDVAAAARSFAVRVGAGPFFLRCHIPLTSAVHAGQPGVFDHSSAYGQWGGVVLELVEVHRAEPAGLADIVQRTSGVHHVAWLARSVDEERERLERLGWLAVLLAETSHGSRFAFHDARDQLGHLVEIYEPSERLLAFYDSVADAAFGWTGADPVRES